MKRTSVPLNIVWNWVCLACVAIAGLVITPILITRLGDHGYGAWVLLGSILGYYGLLNFGIDTSVVRYISKHLAERDLENAADVLHVSQIYFVAVGFAVLLISLLLAAAFAFSDFVFQNFFNLTPALRLDFSLLLIFLGIGTSISYLARVHQSVLKAVERFDLVNGIVIVSVIGRTIAVIYFMGNSLVRLGCLFAFFDILASMAFVISARAVLARYGLSRTSFCQATFKKITRYGMFAFLTCLADQFRFQTAPMVIGHFLAMAMVTYYSLANTLVSSFRSITGSFGIPFFPLFSRYDGEMNYDGMRKVFLRASKIQAFIGMLLCGGILGSVPSFLQLWVGQSISTENIDLSCRVLLVLLFPNMLDVMQSVSINYLYGISKHPYLAWLTTVEGILSLSLGILLVKPLGIMGVAMGAAIPMTIAKLIIQPLYVCRSMKISALVYISHFLVIPIVLAIVLGLIQRASYTIFFAPQSFVSLFVIAGVTTAAFGLLVSLVYFSREDRIFLRDYYRQWRTT